MPSQINPKLKKLKRINKMNRKASETLMDNTIFLVLLVLYTAIMFFYVLNQEDGASVWADYYSKELTKSLNLAEPGDEIMFDIHKATEIAKGKGVSDSEIFAIDRTNKQACVKLSQGRKTCYSYFNDVDIIWEIKRAQPEKNILILKIREPKK